MSESVKLIGKIIPSNFFGGTFINFDFPEPSLYRCLNCHLKFKLPVLEEAQLIKLYGDVDSDAWRMGSRNDFRLVLTKLREIGTDGKRVLDIGCNRGDLLGEVPGSVTRFGVEPNKKQHAACYANRFDLVWSSLEEAQASGQTFDVISMTDVIEHVSRPSSFLEMAFSCLRPGGSLIITTGDSDSILWKIFAQNNWYPFYQEHVSFISFEWLNSISIKDRITSLEIVNFAYINHGLKSFAKHAIMAAVMGISPSLYKFIFRVLGYKSKELFPFGFGLTRDHMMAILKKEI